MIIGINGYIGSGKDTVAMLIQALTMRHNGLPTRYAQEPLVYLKNYEGRPNLKGGWQIKKFAYKLKLMVSLLTGIPVEDLEKQEVKERQLGPEWDKQMIGYTFTGTHQAFRDFCNISLNIQPRFESPIQLNSTDYIFTYYKKVDSMTVRDLLQKLGTDAVRDRVHPNAWVNALMSEYKSIGKYGVAQHIKGTNQYMIPDDKEYPKEHHYKTIDDQKFKWEEWPNWIISDCRFPNEGQAIKDRGGVIWRINRPQNELPIDTLTGKKLMDYPRHSSETSLDNWPFDRVIENDGGLEDLLSKVKVALQEGGFL